MIKMNDLIKNSNSIKNSIINIEKHFGKVKNNNEFTLKHNCDLSETSLKRSIISNETFSKYNFSRSTLTGSVFKNTRFIDCNFDSAVAEFCDFYNCEFVQTLHSNTMLRFNFSNTNFINCKFTNIGLYTSSLTNALFKDVEFYCCNIDLASFENSVFENTKFFDMELRNLNIEFAEFKNIVCSRVTFQISQISYIFGALDYLLSTNDSSIWISSEMSDNDKKISIQEFKELLPDLINYYKYLNEYFPLANIYIALKQYKEALKAIYNGIDTAAKNKDFRMLKFFCKLVVRNEWSSKTDRKNMYNYICNLDKKIKMTDAELHNYYLHFGDLRKLLLNNEENMPTLYYTIDSNIPENDFKKLSMTMESIDRIINHCKDEQSTHYIEIRHESPFTIMVVVISTVTIIQSICYCIDKICSSVKNVQEVKINQQIIKKNAKELEKIVAEEQEKAKRSGIILTGNSYINNN